MQYSHADPIISAVKSFSIQMKTQILKLNYSNIKSFIDPSIDWLIGRSIDPLIDWWMDTLTDWLIDWSIDRSIDWLVLRSIHWLIDWLIGRSIDPLIDWLIDWRILCCLKKGIFKKFKNSLTNCVRRRKFHAEIDNYRRRNDCQLRIPLGIFTMRDGRLPNVVIFEHGTE